jgi:ferric-dicitrate binding protein FerR (iron transport regulator)
MMDEQSSEAERGDAHLAGLIRQGGARAQPSRAARDAAREAVRAEWKGVVAARSRRRAARWSVAGAAVAAGVAAWIALPLLEGPAPAVAAVVRVSGPVDIGSSRLLGSFARIAPGAAVAAGREIRSGEGGRLALTLGGTVLRVDQRSDIEVLAADRVALKRGAIYVDSGNDPAASSPLVVETPYGSVEHLGTQYETRVADGTLRVRVREGKVRLAGQGQDQDQAVAAVAGEQVTLGASGMVRREPVAPSGGDWAWVGEIAPAYDIQGRPLLEFLQWASRETGRQLAFATPASEQAAREVRLSGSVQGLSPERALGAVLATTGLQYTETPEELRIHFKAGD